MIKKHDINGLFITSWIFNWYL